MRAWITVRQSCINKKVITGGMVHGQPASSTVGGGFKCRNTCFGVQDSRAMTVTWKRTLALLMYGGHYWSALFGLGVNRQTLTYSVISNVFTLSQNVLWGTVCKICFCSSKLPLS